MANKLQFMAVLLVDFKPLFAHFTASMATTPRTSVTAGVVLVSPLRETSMKLLPARGSIDGSRNSTLPPQRAARTTANTNQQPQ